MTDKQKKEFKIVEVRGKAYYAKVHTPVEQYDKTKPKIYSIDLVVDDKELKLLKTFGLSPASKEVIKDDVKSYVPKEYPEYLGQRVFTFKRKTVKADGSENSPLPVVDAKTNYIPKTILIGNGSDVIVSINPFSALTKTGLVHTANLLAVQVLDLVPYTSKAKGHNFTQKEGFTVDTSLTNVTDDDIPF